MFNLDASEARQTLLQTIEALERFDANTPDRLRRVAAQAANTVQQRIQQRGENANGDRMQTRSRETKGVYSRDYGTQREQAGLQTGIIDLTYSGRLFDAWGASADGDDYGVGFSDFTMSQRADYLEEYFGPIFQLSPIESDEAVSLMAQLNQQDLDYL